jgi:hypothetical protein
MLGRGGVAQPATDVMWSVLEAAGIPKGDVAPTEGPWVDQRVIKGDEARDGEVIRAIEAKLRPFFGHDDH